MQAFAFLWFQLQMTRRYLQEKTFGPEQSPANSANLNTPIGRCNSDKAQSNTPALPPATLRVAMRAGHHSVRRDSSTKRLGAGSEPRGGITPNEKGFVRRGCSLRELADAGGGWMDAEPIQRSPSFGNIDPFFAHHFGEQEFTPLRQSRCEDRPVNGRI